MKEGREGEKDREKEWRKEWKKRKEMKEGSKHRSAGRRERGQMAWQFIKPSGSPFSTTVNGQCICTSLMLQDRALHHTKFIPWLLKKTTQDRDKFVHIENIIRQFS